MKKRMQKCAAFISAFMMLSANAFAAELFSVTEDFAKRKKLFRLDKGQRSECIYPLAGSANIRREYFFYDSVQ